MGTGKTELKVKRMGRSFSATILLVRTTKTVANVAANHDENRRKIVLHRRLAHLSTSGLRQGVTQSCWKNRPEFDGMYTVSSCIECDRGKVKNSSFGSIKETSRWTHRLQLIYIDVCGPIKQNYFGKYHHFIDFVDDYSRKTFVHFLKHKSETNEKVSEILTYVKRQTGDRARSLHSGNGGKYNSKSLKYHLKQRGIVFKKTEAYLPQQNGIEERVNRVLMDKSRSMIKCMKVPPLFWVLIVIICIKPDIAYAVNNLAQHCEAPKVMH